MEEGGWKRDEEEEEKEEAGRRFPLATLNDVHFPRCLQQFPAAAPPPTLRRRSDEI